MSHFTDQLLKYIKIKFKLTILAWRSCVIDIGLGLSGSFLCLQAGSRPFACFLPVGMPLFTRRGLNGVLPPFIVHKGFVLCALVAIEAMVVSIPTIMIKKGLSILQFFQEAITDDSLSAVS